MTRKPKKIRIKREKKVKKKKFQEKNSIEKFISHKRNFKKFEFKKYQEIFHINIKTKHENVNNDKLNQKILLN